MSAIAVLCGGLPLSAALAGGLAAPPAAAVALTGAEAPGSVQACAAYAYAAIERHTVVTATPPECRGLGRAQVNQAAGIAIRRAATGAVKSTERKEAGAAARWVSAMITGPAPAPAQTAPAPAARPPGGGRPGDQAGGLGLGGVSELAAKIGALLAWLATAGSGGYVLVRWLLAGGSALRRTTTAAPPAVILAHVGAGALGLLLWVCFLLSGWTALAWTALAILAPTAGLGMGMLLLGLPSPVRPPIGARATEARAPGRRTRIPVAAIVGHGMFAVTALLLVLMATIGAG
jgi:hypothetical protein